MQHNLCYAYLPDLRQDENWLHDFICSSLFEHLSVLVLVPRQVSEQLLHSLHEGQTDSYFSWRISFPSISFSNLYWHSWASFRLAVDDDLRIEFWVWRFLVFWISSSSSFLQSWSSVSRLFILDSSSLS